MDLQKQPRDINPVNIQGPLRALQLSHISHLGNPFILNCKYLQIMKHLWLEQSWIICEFSYGKRFKLIRLSAKIYIIEILFELHIEWAHKWVGNCKGKSCEWHMMEAILQLGFYFELLQWWFLSNVKSKSRLSCCFTRCILTWFKYFLQGPTPINSGSFHLSLYLQIYLNMVSLDSQL
jgi:hypothetical protein